MEQDHCNIYVSQRSYIERRLERIQIEQAGFYETKTKLTEDNKAKLRQLIGRIRWVSDQSRPGMSYEELELSIAASAPTIKDWRTANEVVKKLKDAEVQIKYPKLKQEKWYISVFMDARKLPDGVSSVMGTLMFLSNGYRPQQRKDCCILSWRSSKVTRLDSSSYEAEALCLSEGLEEALVMKKLILDMTRMEPENLEVEVFYNNEDKNKVLVAKVKKTGVAVQWIQGQYQLADGLTRKGASRIPILEAIKKGRFMN